MTKIANGTLVLLFLGTAGISNTAWSEASGPAQIAQMEHHQGDSGHSLPSPKHEPGSHPHGMHGHPRVAPAKARLHPAEGAEVKILSPKAGQIFHGDEVPVHFRFVKGKRGHHLHAYVDGELMGMFSSEKGTLTGMKPGRHTLEVRVVAEDHQTELEAVDRIHFVVQ